MDSRFRGNGTVDDSMNNITFFTTQSHFRRWLEKNHTTEKELWIGFYKKDSNKKGITYKEAVDEALCFGWIDGIRKKVNEESYTNRFTPRKPKSNWSVVNSKRVQELTQLGVMHESGLAAFSRKESTRTQLYSFEQKNVQLPSMYEKKIKSNKKAWQYFQTQAPWYKKSATWWVISAKQEITKLKRLESLIECSENGKTIPPLTRKNK